MQQLCVATWFEKENDLLKGTLIVNKKHISLYRNYNNTAMAAVSSVLRNPANLPMRFFWVVVESVADRKE